MNYLRQYIRNTILLEMAMKQSRDLPQGWAFACRIDGAYSMPQIILVGPDGYVHHREMKVQCYFSKITSFKEDPHLQWGVFVNDETKEELGYDCFDLRRLDSQPRGYGPLITDIAIEWATLLGGILFPDRRDMSDEAQGMWDKYASRTGVTQYIHPQLGTVGYRKSLDTILQLEDQDQLFLKKRNHDTRVDEKLKLSENPKWSI